MLRHRLLNCCYSLVLFRSAFNVLGSLFEPLHQVRQNPLSYAPCVKQQVVGTLRNLHQCLVLGNSFTSTTCHTLHFAKQNVTNNLAPLFSSVFISLSDGLLHLAHIDTLLLITYSSVLNNRQLLTIIGYGLGVRSQWFDENIFIGSQILLNH